MAYSPLNLGEIIGQANHLKAQQQQSQLAGLQIGQVQKGIEQQGAVDTALANPNSSLADYARGGLQGVQAYSAVQGAQATADMQTYRKMYGAANEVLVASNPVEATKRISPDYVKEYEKQNGPGSFDKAPVEEIRKHAVAIRDHALSLLVDPDKQFQADAAMNLALYNQEGPGGEKARAEATLAGENERAAASNRVSMRGQDITARGQDLTDARSRESNLISQGNNNQVVAGKIRDDYNQTVKNTGWYDQQGFYQRLKTIGNDKTGASDLALVFSYMKVLDPTSAVREGEYATAKDTAGIPSKIVAQYNKVVSGAFLAPAQRDEFLKTADKIYQAGYKRQEAIQKDYSSKAERAGLDPRDVITDMGAPAPTPDAAAPAATPAVGTVVDGYRFKGGDPSRKTSWEQVQ